MRRYRPHGRHPANHRSRSALRRRAKQKAPSQRNASRPPKYVPSAQAAFHIKRQKQKRRRRRFLFGSLFAVAVLILFVQVLYPEIQNLIRGPQITELPSLRQEANQKLVRQLLVSDTSKRPLSQAEKEEDGKVLKEVLLQIPVANSKALQEGTFARDTQALWESLAKGKDDESFFQDLQKLLSYLGDPLTHMILPKEYNRLRKELGSGFFENHSPYAAALNEEKVIDRYRRYPEEGASSGKKDAQDKTTTEKKGPQLRLEKEGKIAILSHLAFREEGWKEEEAKLNALLSQAASSKLLVLDLRNTQGDSYRYWTDLLLPKIRRAKGASSNLIYFPQAFDRYVDYLSTGEKLTNFNLSEKRTPLQVQEKQDKSFATEGLAYKKTLTVSTSGEGSPRYLGRIMILVDHQTGASAESFAQFCQLNQIAEIQGEKTAGTGFDIPPFLLSLPHSGFLVQIHGTVAESPHGEQLQRESALTPDLQLSGKDLLQTLLEKQ